MPTPFTRWRCDECGEMHLSEAAARICESGHAIRIITDGFRDDLATIMARRESKRKFMQRARARLGLPDPDDADHLPPEGVPQF